MAGGPLSDRALARGWQLRRLSVCASTEVELARWLAARQTAAARLAVVARRQRFGVGQQGRTWVSPPGGLWLSAAFPWRQELPGSASLGLAAAVGIALQLELLGVAVQLKWPNDLLVDGCKLAGLLPRLRMRGPSVRWAQVGVGINGCNRLPAIGPPGAISLAQALGGQRHHPQARPERLLPRVLAGLDWAAAHADQPETVRLAAEARLWHPEGGWLQGDETWQVLGLHADGRLRLGRAARELALMRVF